MKTELLDGAEGLVDAVDAINVGFLEIQYVWGDFFAQPCISA